MPFRKVSQEERTAERAAEKATCTRCLRELPVSDFTLSSASVSGRHSWCRNCTREYNAAYYEREKATGKWNLYSRKKGLKSLYGMTEEDYEDLLESQDGGCAICGTKDGGLHKQTGKQKKLGVDHNEETGVVRGLLCSTHNMALGLFDHNVDLLIAAAAYLLHTEEED